MYGQKLGSMSVGVTTQAHEGIETFWEKRSNTVLVVTTQAHEGIETLSEKQFLDSDW